MKNIISILCLALFILTEISAQTQISHSVNFDSDKSEILGSSEKNLDKFFMSLSALNEYEIEIIGHTDQDGSYEYNRELSQRRANSVSQYLVDRGVESNKIRVQFQGESNLLKQSNDEESKSINRRVEISVKGYSYHSVEEVISNLENDNEESHSIRNAEGSIINLAKGTEVRIPQDAFCNNDGSAVGNGVVEVTLIEAHNYLEMIDQNLFTQTEGEMLETGGMIYIEAKQNGNLLRLNDGKSIEVLLPEQKEKPGMELFTGKEDADGVIWEATGEVIPSLESEKEEMFLQVDLSPILDFEYHEYEDTTLVLSPMPRYPHPKRKAYPPAKSVYSEKKYNEVYQKYEEVMKVHNEFEKIRPEKLKKWNEEYALRKEALLNHQKLIIKQKIQKRILYYLAKIEKQKSTVSHHLLVGELENAINRNLGKVPFEKQKLLVAYFGENYNEVLEQKKFRFRNYEQLIIADFLPALLVAGINEVKSRIIERKHELGYVDKKSFSRFLVTTTELGWINCDRFLEYDDSELTQLVVADDSEDRNYYLIFKDFKSMLRPKKTHDGVVFDGIPKGEDVRLVSIGFGKGKKALLATQDLTLGKEEELKLMYRAVNIEELKHAIKS